LLLLAVEPRLSRPIPLVYRLSYPNRICVLDIKSWLQTPLLREEFLTVSVVWWSEFLATDPEVPGSILGATRFSE
jgi:hypothetical protein